MSARINRGLLCQEGSDQNITDEGRGGGDLIDPFELQNPSVSNETRDMMFEEAVEYLREVRERIRIREADSQMSVDATSCEETTSNEEMASSEEEEPSCDSREAGGLVTTGSETINKGENTSDEDKNGKLERSAEVVFATPQPRRKTATTRKSDRRSQNRRSRVLAKRTQKAERSKPRTKANLEGDRLHQASPE